MISTLFITLLTEGAVIVGYAARRKQPFSSLLLTSLLANLITQSLLWMALKLFFQNYLLTLLVAEALIWIVECLLMYLVPANQLKFSEAMLLSLVMNMTSLITGWFLPV